MNDQTTTIKTLMDKMKVFREARGWENEDAKDMAISLVLEAAELLEYFQWHTGEEVEEEAKLKGPICDELADVLWWVLVVAERLGIDVAHAFELKMIKNDKKYPVEKFGREIDPAAKRRAYYRIKAATRGGHPLADDVS